MLIPTNKDTGLRTVSVSQLRTYGVAGFDVGLHEESRGCPRQYEARYVTRTAPKTTSEILVYGRVIHAAFEHMEQQSVGPEDALAAVWDPSLPPERYAEALDDLRSYMERPATSGAVIGSEIELAAVLFEDGDGPVMFRGFLDTVEVDWQDPFLLHVRDFKTNRTPPSTEDARKDAQGKGYSWLVLQNLDRFGFAPEDHHRVRVVFHLDAIKWRELPAVYFNEADLEAWHAWMVAIVRHIQADDQALPILNPGCAVCPVRDTCSKFKSLPDVGEAEADELMEILGTESADKATLLAALAEVRPEDREALMEWREHANSVRLLLQKAVAEIDARLAGDAWREGGMRVGSTSWEIVDDKRNTTDARRLHAELGDERFYRLVSGQISRAALEREVAGAEPGLRARVLDCVRPETVGSKLKKGR